MGMKRISRKQFIVWVAGELMQKPEARGQKRKEAPVQPREQGLVAMADTLKGEWQGHTIHMKIPPQDRQNDNRRYCTWCSAQVSRVKADLEKDATQEEKWEALSKVAPHNQKLWDKHQKIVPSCQHTKHRRVCGVSLCLDCAPKFHDYMDAV
jgi:hypothetical protein